MVSNLSDFIGRVLIFAGLVYFVIGYQHYSINYIGLLTSGQIDERIMSSFSMLYELGEHLNAFILQGYDYAMREGKLDFSIYKQFYSYFWSYQYTLLIGAGMYLKVTGSPIQRIKQIISFSLVFILVLLIEIPIK